MTKIEDPAELREEINGLRESCRQKDERFQIVSEQLSAARGELRRAREDINTIASMLHAEADQRGYCADYDDVIRDINRELHFKMPPRLVTYEVSFKMALRPGDISHLEGYIDMWDLSPDGCHAFTLKEVGE